VHGINWGDVPTWLAVVVASVGGGIALRQLRLQGDVIKGEIERNAARDKLLDGQLRELNQREMSRVREQAEAIDVTWDDLGSDPGASLVVVINGSRRPITSVSCLVYPLDDDNEVEPLYCAEMRPADSPRPEWVMPDIEAKNDTELLALRAGGRAGFHFQVQKTGSSTAYINFYDDAGNYWLLSSDLALSPADS